MLRPRYPMRQLSLRSHDLLLFCRGRLAARRRRLGEFTALEQLQRDHSKVGFTPLFRHEYAAWDSAHTSGIAHAYCVLRICHVG